MRRAKSSSLAVLLSFIGALLPMLSAPAATENPAKRVLILHSFGSDVPPYSVISTSFQAALAREFHEPVEIYEASLDTGRFAEPEKEDSFVYFLEKRFARRQLDLVVPIGFPAASFAVHQRERLFAHVPMLISAAEASRLGPEFFTTHTAVVSTTNNRLRIVESILHLLPSTTNIAVVMGSSPYEQRWLAQYRQEFRQFLPRVNFTWFSELSFAEIRRRAAALPPNSAIFFARFVLDSAGVPYDYDQALKSLHAVADAPIFGQYESQFGLGIVGGSLFSEEATGVRTAQVAVRILRGEVPSRIATKPIEDSPPVYDWRELQRWGISEARLPPGSIVQFREPHLWERHKREILMVLLLFFFGVALIVMMLWERRRRRLAQQGLDERLRFEKLLSDLSGTFINLAADRVEGQIHDALGAVARFLKFDIATLSVFTGQSIDSRLAFVWTAEGLPEIPSHLSNEDFPWSAEALFAGHDVCLRTLDELPGKAQPDRANYEKYHVRSSYSVPMIAGGRVIGALGLHAVSQEREVSPELLQGQRLLGEIFANVLARKLAEESLRDSEQNFRRLVESTAAVPWQADVETWNFTYVGPQAVKLLGYPVERWYEKDFWMSHLHPDDRESAVNTCLTLSKSAESFEFEYQMIASSGKAVWVHDIVKCEHRHGQPTELRGFMIDISERKQSEAALRESETRFRTMADTAPVMIWMSGPDKLCTFFNRGWLDFTGRTLEQELGNGWAEGVHREDFDRCLEVYVDAFDARREFRMEYRLRKYDGEYRWILDHGVPRFASDGAFLGYIGSCIDVGERKRAQEALEKERAFLRQVIDINPNFIFAKDRDGRFTLVNQAVADAYGTSVGNLTGRTDADFNQNLEEIASFRRMDLEVMNTLRERFIPEEQITDAAGKVRWLQTVKRPIIEKDGSAHQVLGASTDITQRKQTELELRQEREELAHVTRISTMGELAASLAHELNQPLTAILSNAQAAQRFMAANPADLEEVREILKDIVQDNSRASEVIRRMRALVRKGELEIAPLDVAAVIGDVVMMVRSDAIRHNIRVLLELHPDLPPVRGDKVQLQQVMLNLLLNAFDALKDCPVAERQVAVQAQLDGARLLRVAVRDRGVGLSGDKLAKIFQPFYTTKHDGLGMGLSICRSIVNAHGGGLWAENNSDRGATFYFTVPLGEEAEKGIME